MNITEGLQNLTTTSPETTTGYNYDEGGALYYVVAVCCVYGISVFLLVASHIRRRSHNLNTDMQVSKYFRIMRKLRRAKQKDDLRRNMSETKKHMPSRYLKLHKWPNSVKGRVKRIGAFGRKNPSFDDSPNDSFNSRSELSTRLQAIQEHDHAHEANDKRAVSVVTFKDIVQESKEKENLTVVSSPVAFPFSKLRVEPINSNSEECHSIASDHGSECELECCASIRIGKHLNEMQMNNYESRQRDFCSGKMTLTESNSNQCHSIASDSSDSDSDCQQVCQPGCQLECCVVVLSEKQSNEIQNGKSGYLLNPMELETLDMSSNDLGRTNTSSSYPIPNGLDFLEDEVFIAVV